jgi:flagellar P-ring protein FlgI
VFARIARSWMLISGKNCLGRAASRVGAALVAMGVGASWGATALGQFAGGAPEARDGNVIRQTADVVMVQDLARIQGQGINVLRGMGLVTGLRKGTGDKGTELALARPLAKVYEANAMSLPDVKDVAGASSVALVALEVVIPPQGAREGDLFDVRVTTIHSASDLTGGQLLLSPLMGPRADDQNVYAMGFGTIMIESVAAPAGPGGGGRGGDQSLTSGVIRGGARMLADVRPAAIRDKFVLTLQPAYRHYTIASRLADAINGEANAPSDGLGLSDRLIEGDVAKALDDTSVLVTVPPEEASNVPQFVARVMATQVTLSLLQQPAEVRINTRTGSIVFSGNVEISPVAISHKNLTITTAAAAPGGGAAGGNGQVAARDTLTSLDTVNRGRDKARLADLLAAFRQLDVPMEDRINIVMQLHRSGRLHARLVVE